MRFFRTRFMGSVSRNLLLAPCLLISLACATPFPLENLEEGMTMVQATEAFGEPSSTNIGELHEAVQLLQKENARIFEDLESTVDLSETRGPVARKLEQSSTQTLRSLEEFLVELDEARGGEGVVSTWVYPHEEAHWGEVVILAILPMAGWLLLSGDAHIEKQEVELLFEGNKLASWETRPAPSVPTTGTYYVYQNPFPNHSLKDTQHHKMGHDHHH